MDMPEKDYRRLVESIAWLRNKAPACERYGLMIGAYEACLVLGVVLGRDRFYRDLTARENELYEEEMKSRDDLD